MLDNRDLALLIWLVIALATAVLMRTGRNTLRDISKVALETQVSVIFLLMIAYGATIVWQLASLGLWTKRLIPETVLWLAGPGVVLIFRAVTSRGESETFFRYMFLATLRVTILIEFLVNLYPVHLILELVFVPVFVVLGGILALAESREEHVVPEGRLQVFMALVGLAMLSDTAANIIRDPGGFATLDTLREFLLPILLTAAFIPFIYFLAVYASYEMAFNYIDFRAPEGAKGFQAKLALVLRLHGRTRVIDDFTMYWGKEMAEAGSFRAAWRAASQFLASREARREAKVKEEARLVRYAGVEGADDDGQRLDQREFKETREALQALATAQMGWYRNRGGSYRLELLDILQSRFERCGLPADHGISLHVTDDSQSWWAWRRTVTGWCFAVGAAGPPPDEWLFDGPEPPSGPPGQDPAWGARWGVEAPNW